MVETAFRHIDVKKVEQKDGALIVTFLDRQIIDPAQIHDLGEELWSLVGADACPAIVVNFERVGFFASQALNKLIILDRKMRASKPPGELRLCHIDPPIYEVLAITRLNQYFTIRPTLEEALKSF